MDVILLEDIAKLGKRYETRSVAPGYARNYLIRRGLVLLSTERALENIKRLQSLEAEKKKDTEQRLVKSLEELGDFELLIKERANTEGHLFGAIRAADIVKALADKNINLNEEHILLKSPIKQTGVHELSLLVGEREFKFKLKVENN